MSGTAIPHRGFAVPVVKNSCFFLQRFAKISSVETGYLVTSHRLDICQNKNDRESFRGLELAISGHCPVSSN